MKTCSRSVRLAAIWLLAPFLTLVPAHAADEAAIKAEIEAVRKAGIAQWKDRLPDNFETYVRDTGTRNYYQREFNAALTNGNATAMAGVFKEFPEFGRAQFLNNPIMQGKSALHYAVERGHREVVTLLLEQKVGADAPRPTAGSPFGPGSFRPPPMGFPPGYQERRDTPLHAAVRTGNTEMATLLLDAGANIEALDQRGESSLYTCVRLLGGTGYNSSQILSDPEARARQTDMIALLLKRGAQVLPTNRFYTSYHPLTTVLQQRNETMLDLFLTNSTHLAATSFTGDTLTHLAVTLGRTNALQALLKKQPPLTIANSNGLTPLRQAAWLPAIAQMPTPSYYSGGNSSIDPAGRAGFLRQRTADLLLAGGAEADALALAGLNRTNELAALLRRDPTQANTRDPQERTPLHYAVNAKSTAALQLLLATKADINARDKSGLTPLLRALTHHLSGEATLLLAAGASVSVTNSIGQTALHIAVGGGDTNLFAQIAAAGADINARDAAGKSVMEFAAHSQRFDLVQWLETRGAATVPSAKRLMTTPLHQAVAQGNVQQVLRLLTNAVSADVNARNEQGLTPLALAVGASRVDIVTMLLTNGANVNIADTNGVTPLRARFLTASDVVPESVPKPGFSKRLPAPTSAKQTSTRADTLPPELRPTTAHTAQSAISNLLLLLLENGADPKLPDAKGNTILHVLQPALTPPNDFPRKAAYPPLLEAVARVRLLANYGLAPDTRAGNGHTPLHAVAVQGNLIYAFALLEAGAGVNTPDQQGRTALHHALLPPASRWRMEDVIGAHRDRPHLLALLLDNGADLRRTDTNGATALHLLPAMDDTLRELVLPALRTNRHFAAALRVKNNAGQTPVLLAFEQLRSRPVAPVVKMLSTFLSNGGELPPTAEQGGTTPLHELAAIGTSQADAATLAFLTSFSNAAVAKAARVDVRNSKGETPLHVATRHQNAPFATALLARGANPNAQDAQGDTPLHLALRTISHRERTHPVIPLLISNKCDFLLRNLAGESPLRMEINLPFHRVPLFLPPGATQGFFFAARAGDLASVEAYLAVDPSLATLADPTSQTSLLRSAAMAGQVEVAERLRKAGASDPVSAAVLGWTNSLAVFAHQSPRLGESNFNAALPFNVGVPLLHLAVSRGQAASVRLLLNDSVSTRLEDFMGRTAIYHATTNGNPGILALLKAHGTRPSLLDAISLGDVAMANSVLASEPAAGQSTNLHFSSALMLATEAGHKDIVLRLLAHGADPNWQLPAARSFRLSQYLAGTTPLHMAAWSNRTDLAESLIGAKADLTARNSSGYSALHFAAAQGHREMTAWLLAQGADPNVQAVVSFTNGPGMFPPRMPYQVNAGWTPLHLAVRYGHPALIELLVAKGAKLDTTDAQGRTPADLTQRQFGIMDSPWPPSPYQSLAPGMPIADASRDPARHQAVVEALKKVGAVIPTTRGASFSSPFVRPGGSFPVPPPPPSVVAPPVKK